MKIRNGFVSNSSSSSFIVRNLTKEQKELIFNKNYYLPISEKWYIYENDLGNLEFDVSMDNFQWEDFLWEIGVKKEDMKYTS